MLRDKSIKLTLLVSLLALTLPLSAGAKDRSAKIEPRLAAEAAASAPSRDLRVLVSGTNPEQAISSVGGTVEGSLGLVDTVAAPSAHLPAIRLSQAVGTRSSAGMRARGVS